MPILPQTVRFKGTIYHNRDISAIASFNIDGISYLAIGSDESERQVQLLKQTSAGVYEVDKDREINLSTAEASTEIDIESIAFDPQQSCLYIIGSHSQKRKTVKVEDKTAAKNRQRLTDKKISPETERNRIFQVALQSKHAIAQLGNLKEVLAKDSYLKRFVDIPSKENGIDIEGLAFYKGSLFLGFRGPILRGNYVPVMVLKSDAVSNAKVNDYEIRFVQLNGLAIRDMTAVQNGFLIIGGPMGDAPGPYGIYFWDGSDMIYGVDRPLPMPPAVIQLEEIIPPVGEGGNLGKAEGITVLKETATGYQVLVVYDSLTNGSPQIWHINKAFT